MDQFQRAALDKMHSNRKDPFVTGGYLNDEDLERIEEILNSEPEDHLDDPDDDPEWMDEHTQTKEDLAAIKGNLTVVSEAMDEVVQVAEQVEYKPPPCPPIRNARDWERYMRTWDYITWRMNR
jgi:hypothetical protein